MGANAWGLVMVSSARALQVSKGFCVRRRLTTVLAARVRTGYASANRTASTAFATRSSKEDYASVKSTYASRTLALMARARAMAINSDVNVLLLTEAIYAIRR